METWVRLFVLTPPLREGAALNTPSSEGWTIGVGGLAATGRVVLFWAGVGGLTLA